MGLINCPGACSAQYLTNTIVNLTATPQGTVTFNNFSQASDIWVVGDGTIWVTDFGLNRVVQLSEAGAETGVMFGAAGTGNGQFSNPFGSHVVGSTIYVTDCNGNRVQYFDLSGNFLGKWGGVFGTGNGQFKGPFGITADGSGNIYVCDSGNHRVQKFDSTGTFITKWGTNGSGNTQFFTPEYIWYAPATDELYVVDRDGNCVKVFNTSGVFQRRWGTFGSGNSNFNVPQGIVISADGSTVWVVDQNNTRIQKFTSAGVYVDTISLSDLSTAGALGIDSSGNFYLIFPSITKLIDKLDPNGTLLYSMPFHNTIFAGWSGDVPAGHGNDNPLSITMDRTRNIIATFS